MLILQVSIFFTYLNQSMWTKRSAHCDAQPNILLCVCVPRSVARNVPLTSKPNHTQITLWHLFFPINKQQIRNLLRQKS